MVERLILNQSIVTRLSAEIFQHLLQIQHLIQKCATWGRSTFDLSLHNEDIY